MLYFWLGKHFGIHKLRSSSIKMLYWSLNVTFMQENSMQLNDMQLICACICVVCHA